MAIRRHQKRVEIMTKKTGLICAAGAAVLCGSLVASARVSVSGGLTAAPVSTFDPFAAGATPAAPVVTPAVVTPVVTPTAAPVTAPPAEHAVTLPPQASPIAVQVVELQLRPPPRSPYRPPPSGGLF